MIPANISAAQRFVDLVTVGTIPTREALARSLDELALSYHDTPVGDPSESEAEPPSEIDSTYAVIAARFPDLGFYGTVFQIDVPGEAILGDAIDDILDITNDLKEVLWRFEQFGADDAHWYFRMLFQIHWVNTLEISLTIYTGACGAKRTERLQCPLSVIATQKQPGRNLAKANLDARPDLAPLPPRSQRLAVRGHQVEHPFRVAGS